MTKNNKVQTVLQKHIGGKGVKEEILKTGNKQQQAVTVNTSQLMYCKLD